MLPTTGKKVRRGVARDGPAPTELDFPAAAWFSEASGGPTRRITMRDRRTPGDAPRKTQVTLARAAKPLPGTLPDPMYPDSDGRPMGDTDFHSAALAWLREALQDVFEAVLDVYVATNLILYYERGNPKARRDPDVLVAKSVGKHKRRS